MNTATVPRWLRAVLWIVGGVDAVIAVLAVQGVRRRLRAGLLHTR